MKSNYDSRYLEFIHLFNTRKYWHAHEALENLWLAERDHPDRVFFKGLIQLAAVLYHVEKENFTGAWSLFASARGYLSEYPSLHLGIKRDELLRGVKAFVSGREKEGLRTQVPRPMINL